MMAYVIEYTTGQRELVYGITATFSGYNHFIVVTGGNRLFKRVPATSRYIKQIHKDDAMQSQLDALEEVTLRLRHWQERERDAMPYVETVSQWTTCHDGWQELVHDSVIVDSDDTLDVYQAMVDRYKSDQRVIITNICQTLTQDTVQEKAA